MQSLMVIVPSFLWHEPIFLSMTRLKLEHFLTKDKGLDIYIGVPWNMFLGAYTSESGKEIAKL